MYALFCLSTHIMFQLSSYICNSACLGQNSVGLETNSTQFEWNLFLEYLSDSNIKRSIYFRFQFQFFICVHALCKKLKLKLQKEIERELHGAGL